MQARSDLRPALIASVAFHGAIILAAWLAMRSAPPIPTPPVATPVTIVTTAGEANVRPAAQAPTEQTAAEPEPTPPSPQPPAPVDTPTPEPSPPPPPEPAPTPRHHVTPAPEPTPTPSPPKPKPIQHPKPTPAPEPEPTPTLVPKHEPAPKPKPIPRPKPIPKPEPAPKSAEKPQDLDLSALSKSTAKHAPRSALDLSSLSKSHADSALDLSALSSTHHARSAAASLDLSALSAGGQRSAAAKGAARAETARNARPAVGAATTLTGDQLGALRDKLIKLWNLNCSIPGASGVEIVVELRLTPDRQLAGAPRVSRKTSGGASDAVVDAAARRALAAVSQGAPYTELPKGAPLDFNLKFDAKQACGG